MLSAVNQEVQRNTVLPFAPAGPQAHKKRRPAVAATPKMRWRIRMDAFSVSRTVLKVENQYNGERAVMYGERRL